MNVARVLALCVVLSPSLGMAQAPSPAQVGLTTANPNAVQIRDGSGTWTTIGTINPTTHVFTPAGNIPITSGLTPTSGFTDGGLMVSTSSAVYDAATYGGKINGLGLQGASGISFGGGAFYGSIGTVPSTMLYVQPSANSSNTFGVVNGTSSQTFRVYNSYTDASNGSWGTFDWTTNPGALTIGPRSNGTGINAGLILTSNWYGGGISIDLTPGYIGLSDSAIEVGGRLDVNGGPITINAGVYVAGLAGVSCAAGAVSLTTLVVTDGIITHC